MEKSLDVGGPSGQPTRPLPGCLRSTRWEQYAAPPDACLRLLLTDYVGGARPARQTAVCVGVLGPKKSGITRSVFSLRRATRKRSGRRVRVSGTGAWCRVASRPRVLRLGAGSPSFCVFLSFQSCWQAKPRFCGLPYVPVPSGSRSVLACVCVEQVESRKAVGSTLHSSARPQQAWRGERAAAGGAARAPVPTELPMPWLMPWGWGAVKGRERCGL